MGHLSLRTSFTELSEFRFNSLWLTLTHPRETLLLYRSLQHSIAQIISNQGSVSQAIQPFNKNTQLIQTATHPTPSPSCTHHLLLSTPKVKCQLLLADLQELSCCPERAVEILVLVFAWIIFCEPRSQYLSS